MDAEVYPDERVSKLISENFIPARVHVRDQAADFQRLGERFGAQWTPTTLMIDAEGKERHRIEGFLPVDDFLAQLELGLGKLSFARADFADAERRYRRITDTYPATEAAPEAQYWAGVSRYKGQGDAKALAETAKAFTERYQDTPWAKKASVWRQ
ncbi:MAG: thioredoxin fold domain-containing protein [Gemmatimonadaceae bacterium]